MAKAVKSKPRNIGYTLEPHQVIIRPLVTEKGMHRSSRLNQYAFEVATVADKDEIRNAVQTLFHVKVLKVRTQSRRGKKRRYKFRNGETKAWKKAIVTVHADQRIDFF